jgi:predicted metalloprotease
VLEKQEALKTDVGSGRATGRMIGRGHRAIAVILLAAYCGVDPRPFLQVMEATMASPQTQGTELQDDEQDDPLAEFVSVVLADTETTRQALFSELGRRYEERRLILCSGAMQSACGLSQAAMSPFYWHGDKQVYIDLGFYRELRGAFVFGAPGGFA